VDECKGSIATLTSDKFGISRQSVNRHINNLIAEGILVSEGKTRSKKYRLKTIAKESLTIPISKELDEDFVWRQHFSSIFTKIKPNVSDICHYGFTEIFNNVIEHSSASLALVEFEQTVKTVKIQVYDNGTGIFRKITRDLKLEDERQAVLELAKGKLTTDPAHHTGEGIFFATRVFDDFSILSGKLYFSHDSDEDWLLEDKKYECAGTMVTMSINTDSDRTLKSVFDKYAADEDSYTFSKTHVPVSLVRYGSEALVSRSQARRLLARFNRFKEVFLDFEGVAFIGQAFADEIFRVFKNEHPEIEIVWVRANKDVENMIKRALSGIQENQMPLALINKPDDTEV
jgi:anti-sigma regulatory factor (Ser/Thr protein kinase)